MYLSATATDAAFICEDVARYTLLLERPLMSTPGQFVMVWIPRVGEIPISVALERGNEVLFVVARKGRVTGYMLSSVRIGSRIFIRGPLGRGFNTTGVKRALVVGGGVGAAPLLYLCKTLAQAGVEVVVALGFRSARCCILVEDIARYASEVHVATEDGSRGMRGTAVDLASKLVASSRFDKVYACGKEIMLKQVVDIARAHKIPVEASLERLVKCGIGLCGACVLEPLGLRVCSDGPVFDGETLAQLEDFGRWWRDGAGRKIPLQP